MYFVTTKSHGISCQIIMSFVISSACVFQSCFLYLLFQERRPPGVFDRRSASDREGHHIWPGGQRSAWWEANGGSVQNTRLASRRWQLHASEFIQLSLAADQKQNNKTWWLILKKMIICTLNITKFQPQVGLCQECLLWLNFFLLCTWYNVTWVCMHHFLWPSRSLIDYYGIYLVVFVESQWVCSHAH